MSNKTNLLAKKIAQLTKVIYTLNLCIEECKINLSNQNRIHQERINDIIETSEKKIAANELALLEKNKIISNLQLSFSRNNKVLETELRTCLERSKKQVEEAKATYAQGLHTMQERCYKLEVNTGILHDKIEEERLKFRDKIGTLMEHYKINTLALQGHFEQTLNKLILTQLHDFTSNVSKMEYLEHFIKVKLTDYTDNLIKNMNSNVRDSIRSHSYDILYLKTELIKERNKNRNMKNKVEDLASTLKCQQDLISVSRNAIIKMNEMISSLQNMKDDDKLKYDKIICCLRRSLNESNNLILQLKTSNTKLENQSKHIFMKLMRVESESRSLKLYISKLSIKVSHAETELLTSRKWFTKEYASWQAKNDLLKKDITSMKIQQSKLFSSYKKILQSLLYSISCIRNHNDHAKDMVLKSINFASQIFKDIYISFESIYKGLCSSVCECFHRNTFITSLPLIGRKILHSIEIANNRNKEYKVKFNKIISERTHLLFTEIIKLRNALTEKFEAIASLQDCHAKELENEKTIIYQKLNEFAEKILHDKVTLISQNKTQLNNIETVKTHLCRLQASIEALQYKITTQDETNHSLIKIQSQWKEKFIHQQLLLVCKVNGQLENKEKEIISSVKSIVMEMSKKYTQLNMKYMKYHEFFKSRLKAIIECDEENILQIQNRQKRKIFHLWRWWNTTRNHFNVTLKIVRKMVESARNSNISLMKEMHLKYSETLKHMYRDKVIRVIKHVNILEDRQRHDRLTLEQFIQSRISIDLEKESVYDEMKQKYLSMKEEYSKLCVSVERISTEARMKDDIISDLKVKLHEENVHNSSLLHEITSERDEMINLSERNKADIERKLNETITTLNREMNQEREHTQKEMNQLKHQLFEKDATIEKLTNERRNVEKTFQDKFKHFEKQLVEKENIIRTMKLHHHNKDESIAEAGDKRISSLEATIQEYHHREKAMKEEIMYYKRELQNREVNFTHRFAGFSEKHELGVMRIGETKKTRKTKEILKR